MIKSILSASPLHSHQPLWTLSGVDLVDPSRVAASLPTDIDNKKTDLLYLFYNAVIWVKNQEMTFDAHGASTPITLLPHFFVCSPSGDKSTVGKATVQGIHETGMLTITPDIKGFGIDLTPHVSLPKLTKPVEIVLVKGGRRAYVHVQLSTDSLENAQYAMYLLVDPASFYKAVQSQFRMNGRLVYTNKLGKHLVTLDFKDGVLELVNGKPVNDVDIFTDDGGHVSVKIEDEVFSVPKVLVQPNDTDHQMFFEGIQPPSGTVACNADVGTYNEPETGTVIVTVNSSFIKLY